MVTTWGPIRMILYYHFSCRYFRWGELRAQGEISNWFFFSLSYLYIIYLYCSLKISPTPPWDSTKSFWRGFRTGAPEKLYKWQLCKSWTGSSTEVRNGAKWRPQSVSGVTSPSWEWQDRNTRGCCYYVIKVCVVPTLARWKINRKTSELVGWWVTVSNI